MSESRKPKETVFLNLHLQDLNPLFYGWHACPAGHSFGPAIRKYTLIHYVTRGKGRVFKGENTYDVSAGQAFLILPGEIVTYVADKQSPWHYEWVAFDGLLSEKFKELPTVLSNFPGELIRQICELSGEEKSEYLAASLLFRLYAELFENKKRGTHYVRKVQDYIRALYMQPLSVEDIATQMSLDRRYLSRLFKQKTGQTVQEYLISVRMEEAKKLLLQGVSVENTAFLCGYEDTCNFSKMFKRRFGVSPLIWKKENQ
ncbi:MAG: AraC family transcriptional regulator [Ruminococcaceae bacterium]|nr:AraC family transcriptional regulator [Oscillospiraceae bacterium]